jgi:hypothetical protein
VAIDDLPGLGSFAHARFDVAPARGKRVVFNHDDTGLDARRNDKPQHRLQATPQELRSVPGANRNNDALPTGGASLCQSRFVRHVKLPQSHSNPHLPGLASCSALVGTTRALTVINKVRHHRLPS